MSAYLARREEDDEISGYLSDRKDEGREFGRRRRYVQLDHVEAVADKGAHRPRDAVHEDEAQLDDRALVVVVQVERRALRDDEEVLHRVVRAVVGLRQQHQLRVRVGRGHVH